MQNQNFYQLSGSRILSTSCGLVLAGLLVLASGCSKPEEESTREIKFYQSPMHPWITSEEPGNCTICGMALTPVYEGESGGDLPDNVIKLSPTSINVIDVATAPVRMAPLERSIRVSGVLDDNDNRHRMVAAHYDGRIEEVFIEHVGEYVKKEQALASIYSPELLYVVREFQNAMRGGDRSLAENSARRLVQFGLTPQQVDRLGEKKEQQYAIDVLAPMDGTILVRDAYPGQYVEEGETMYEMGDLSVLWFHAEVYESDLEGIRLGQRATVTTPAVPGRSFEGTVTFIDPNFDPVTRSTRVRIEVENPVREDGEGPYRVLPHRAYAEAVIHADFGERLVAPRSAILQDGRRSIAYVDRGDGAYEGALVKTGRIGDGLVEIVEGLEVGDRVVVQGNLLIDAEAQMRQGTSVSPGGKSAEPEVTELLMITAKASEALASEQLEAYRETLPHLREALDQWRVTASPDLAAIAEGIDLTAETASLPAAREQFHPLAELAAEVALEAQREGATTEVGVYACPMTKTSFEGAPDKARWVQQPGATRNPYFGDEMLECGVEVKP